MAEAKEEAEWIEFSLSSAIRGIEDENGPTYDESDLKERWRVKKSSQIVLLKEKSLLNLILNFYIPVNQNKWRKKCKL